MRVFRRWFLLCLLIVLPPAALSAHPHMWIRGQLMPEIGRRGLEAVRIVWDIDELTSASLILEYDTDRNGTLDAGEVDALRRGAFEHLYQFEYYLLVEIREMLATPGRAADFDARIDNGRLIYDFRVPLEVAIRWDDIPDVRIFLFDQSYFIDFRPEDIADSTATYRGSAVEFHKARRRSMTRGYGMVDLTGLEVASVDRG